MTNERNSQQYVQLELDKFRDLKDNYLDKLPENPDGDVYLIFKGQNRFFSKVYTKVNDLILNGVIESNSFFTFFEDYMERDRRWDSRANIEDINIINTVLREVIGILEGKLVIKEITTSEKVAL